MSLIKSNASFNVIRKEHCSKFIESLMQSFIHEDNLDIMFICEKSVVVKAHKMIIASVSRFLKKLILDEKDTVYITLPGVDDRKLKLLIHFLYEGISKVSEEELNAIKEVMILLDIHLPDAEVRLSSNFINDISGNSGTKPYSHHGNGLKNNESQAINKGLEKKRIFSRTSCGKVNASITQLQNVVQPLVNTLSSLVDSESLTYFQNENISPFHLPHSILKVKEEIESCHEFVQDLVNNGFKNSINNGNETDQEYFFNTRDNTQDISFPEKNQVADLVADDEMTITGDSPMEELIVAGDTVANYMQKESTSHENDKEANGLCANNSTVLDNNIYPDSEYEEFSDSADTELNGLSDSFHYDVTRNASVQKITENNTLADQVLKPSPVLTTDAKICGVKKKVKLKVGRPSMFSEEQRNILEQTYEENEKPTDETINDLSTKLEMPAKCISGWFIRRQKKEYKRRKMAPSRKPAMLFTEGQKTRLEQSLKGNLSPDIECFKTSSRDLHEPEKRIKNCFTTRQRREKRGKCFPSSAGIPDDKDDKLINSGSGICKIVANVSCKSCGKKFISTNGLKEHNCSTYKKYKCHFCDSSYNYHYRYNEHIKVHLGVKSFKCHRCRQSFSYKRNLVSHIEHCEGLNTKTKGIKGRPAFREKQNIILENVFKVKSTNSQNIKNLSQQLQEPENQAKYLFTARCKRKKLVVKKNVKLKVGRPSMFSEEQRNILEQAYKEYKKPTAEKIKDLSTRLGMPENCIGNWFASRRKKEYKKSSKPSHIFSEEQESLLEVVYETDKYPEKESHKRLALELNVEENMILNWFINRRQKDDLVNTDELISNKESVDNNSTAENSLMMDKVITHNFGIEKGSVLTDAKMKEGSVTSAPNNTLTDGSEETVLQKQQPVTNSGNCKFFAQISCKTCKKKFLFKRSLRLHDCWKYKRYRCIYCDASFVTHQKRDEHIRLHEGVRPYKCKKCNRDFNKKWQLDTHKTCPKVNTDDLISSKESVYNNSTAGNSPMMDEVITHNFGIEKDSVLTDAKMKEDRVTSAPNNTLTAISEETVQQSVDKSENCKFFAQISCKICKKKFLTQKSMSVHNCWKYKRYRCVYCDASFVTHQKRDEHIRLHEGDKPYKCKKCNRAFNQKCNFDSHKTCPIGFRKHGRPSQIFNQKQKEVLEKVFKIIKLPGEQNIKNLCQQLQKPENQVRNWFTARRKRERLDLVKLKNRSHAVASNIQLFNKKRKINAKNITRNFLKNKEEKCLYCDASFKNHHLFSVHMKIHTGEKPFKCHLCTVQFSSKGSLSRHLRNFH